MKFMRATKFIVVVFVVFSLASASSGEQNAKSSSMSEETSVQVQEEIERLLKIASEHIMAREPDKAEVLLKKAIEINDPLFGKNSSRDHLLVANLATVYSRLGRWSEAEEVYKKLYVYENKTDHIVDEQVAYFMMQQGKYAEAKEILRKFIPQMMPPEGGWHGLCANAQDEYYKLKGMLATCESKTRVERNCK